MITPQCVMAKIAVIMGRKEEEILGETDLRELITDSIDLVEVMLGVQESFGVRLTQDELSRVETFAELASLVAAHAEMAAADRASISRPC
jgi:acyl carrier protein